MHMNEDPCMSGWASGSSQHEDSKLRKRNTHVPPLGCSLITPDMRRRMEEEWILLKGKLFGSSENMWEHSDDPKEEDSSNGDPYPDESSEDGARDEEWSDSERSDEGLLDNESFDDEPSNDSSPQGQGFWQYICNVCSQVWDGIKTEFREVFDAIKSTFSWLWDILGGVGSWIKEHLDNFISRITQIFMSSEQQNMGEYIPLATRVF
ncbi:hypothetical protein CBS147343_10413 [Aspergillus niger]|nr:hypothetical protein CBS133816_3267 [Aspergillus niger]KAI2834813.1 hypothetical protein CBS11350_10437 [Aspergillus niger]KAI2920549.1 hypothetical protein CBS147371_3234 [Aspergillus niger]KAI2959730.1 hypothetical protein CBS147324_10237 [Aspergillus niger]KAI2982916.1 hypothetical protein CBS147482_10125 [Aspergillus niger]